MFKLNFKPFLNWKFYVWGVVAILLIIVVTPFKWLHLTFGYIDETLDHYSTLTIKRLTLWMNK